MGSSQANAYFNVFNCFFGFFPVENPFRYPGRYSFQFFSLSVLWTLVTTAISLCLNFDYLINDSDRRYSSFTEAVINVVWTMLVYFAQDTNRLVLLLRGRKITKLLNTLASRQSSLFHQGEHMPHGLWTSVHINRALCVAYFILRMLYIFPKITSASYVTSLSALGAVWPTFLLRCMSSLMEVTATYYQVFQYVFLVNLILQITQITQTTFDNMDGSVVILLEYAIVKQGRHASHDEPWKHKKRNNSIFSSSSLRQQFIESKIRAQIQRMYKFRKLILLFDSSFNLVLLTGILAPTFVCPNYAYFVFNHYTLDGFWGWDIPFWASLISGLFYIQSAFLVPQAVNHFHNMIHEAEKAWRRNFQVLASECLSANLPPHLQEDMLESVMKVEKMFENMIDWNWKLRPYNLISSDIDALPSIAGVLLTYAIFIAQMTAVQVRTG